MDYVLIPSPTLFPYATNNFGNQLCEIRQPLTGDPLANNYDTNISTVNGAARLSFTEVSNALFMGSDRARTTRAGIRLPRGQPMQVFITVVSNPNSNGAPPMVLGTIRTPGATMFSWDVAIQKARTAIYFSSSIKTNPDGSFIIGPNGNPSIHFTDSSPEPSSSLRFFRTRRRLSPTPSNSFLPASMAPSRESSGVCRSASRCFLSVLKIR